MCRYLGTLEGREGRGRGGRWLKVGCEEAEACGGGPKGGILEEEEAVRGGRATEASEPEEEERDEGSGDEGAEGIFERFSSSARSGGEIEGLLDRDSVGS